MDHAPSEQLTGEPLHTTALVLSAGVEHDSLARGLAARLRFRTGALVKWHRATRSYRHRFLQEFVRELSTLPVYVFAISAPEPSISRGTAQFISQLGLDGRYRRVDSMGSAKRISFGPFVRASTGEEVSVLVSENRAAMCLFIAHFVLRMHRRMYEAGNANHPTDPRHVYWNFLGDKFPGPHGSDMELMFSILLSLGRDAGWIRWGYFQESDTVATDLLADNVAGALNEKAKRGRGARVEQLFPEDSRGLFYWETWS
jgi:hypothetical protein